MAFDRRLLPQDRAGRRALAGAVGFAAAGAVLVVAQAAALSRLIDRAFLRGADLAATAGLFAGLVALAFARSMAAAAAEACAGRLGRAAKQRLRAALSRQLVALGPRYAAGQRTGELVRTVTAGVEAIEPYLSQFLPQAILAAVVPVLIGLAVTLADPLSGAVLFVTLPLIPLFMALIGSLAAARTAEQWRTLGRLSARLLDGLYGMATLVAYGRAADHAALLRLTAERLRETTMGVLRVAFLSSLVLELFATVGTALVAVQVGLRLLHGFVEFAPALLVLLLTPEFYKPLRALGAAFHAAMPGREAAARVFEVLETAAPATGVGQPPAGPLEVEFDAVSFSYSAERPALARASFRLPAGSVTALAGPSGAGKSTVAGLLLRFLEPDEGVIRVGGAGLATLDAEAWRSRVAWVPQRPHLFLGSVRENLVLARPRADARAIEAAAALAHFDDVLRELPQGWDTPLGEAGVRLSSGQAQRLALARAFLADAPLLILDEPTAHLDAGLQADLAASIRSLCQGRTVLLIAHRFATLCEADAIVLLARGRVVEAGSPAALRQASGPFARLCVAAEATA